jgi:hypothetical protein
LSDKLLDLRDRIGGHLEDISQMFTQRPKITIIIRTPWLETEGKDGGIVLTNDDFDAAIAEINKFRNRPPTFPADK